MKQKIMPFTWLLACMVILVQIPLFGQGEINKTFSGIKKIVLKTSSGDCVIRKSSDATARVELKTSYDSDEYPAYTLDQTGDRLDISEKYHPRYVHGGGPRWSLTIPNKTEIEFKTGSGSVDVADISLTMSLNTGSGDLSFSNVNGEVRGVTGSGDIMLSNYSGEIDASTGSGGIVVEKSSGNLHLTSGSGNIRIADSKAVFKSSTGSGNVRGVAVTLEGGSSFSAGSGDAEVVLAATPAYDLHVGSGSGDASLNFNGNKVEGKIQLKAGKKYGRIVSPFDVKIVEIKQSGDEDWILEQTVFMGAANHRIVVESGSGEARLREK